MSHNSIEESWQEFFEIVIRGSNFTPNQLACAKKTFFAGAISVLKQLGDSIDGTCNEPEQMADMFIRLDLIGKELNEWQSLQLRHHETN